MNTSDQLYVLIHALTKSEKRYVRMHAGFNRSNSQLLQIFEAISKHNLSNDVALKEQLNHATFLRHLDVLKVHLSRLILNVMRSFHKQSSAQHMLREMVIDIHFLYQKGLFQLCRKQLLKAKKLAEAIPNDIIMIELLDIERKMMGNTEHTPLKLKHIVRVDVSEKAVLRRLRELADFKFASNMSRALIATYQLDPSIANKEKLLQFCSSLHTDKPVPQGAKLIYYGSLFAAYLAVDESQKAIEQGETLVASYLESNTYINEQPLAFIKVLKQLVSITAAIGEVDRAVFYTELLGNLPHRLNKMHKRSQPLSLELNDALSVCQTLLRQSQQ